MENPEPKPRRDRGGLLLGVALIVWITYAQPDPEDL